MTQLARIVGPYIVLLADVLIFYRKVLFSGFLIPWDFEGFHFVFASVVAKSLHNWELALWDPYTYCGMPVYANLSAQMFYPPTLMTILLSNWTGGRKLFYWMEWQLVIHVLLAGIFTFWLLRRLGVGRVASLLGATVFQLGGFFASQTQHLGAMNGAAWMPLAWLALISLSERFQWRWLAVLAFSLAMSFLAGFTAVTCAVFGSCFYLALILVAVRRAPAKLLVYLLLGCAWAGLLASVQLLPSLELTRLSLAGQRARWSPTSAGLPLQSLVSLVSPNHYGIFRFETYHLPWNLTFLYIYCGIPGLLFSLAAIIFRKSRHAIVFFLVTIVSALWMLGYSTPVGKVILSRIPGMIRAPMYFEFVMAAFILGMAVLAGLGADSLVRHWRPALQIALIVVAAGDLIAWGSGRLMNTAKAAEPTATYEQFAGNRSVLEQMRAAVNQTVPPARSDLRGAHPVWRAVAPVIEMPSANGDDPFALLRLLQVRLLFCKGNYWERYFQVDNLESTVLDLLNVRFIIGAESPEPGTTWPPKFRRVGSVSGVQLYENMEALPRFFLVGWIQLASDLSASLAAMRAGDFDPRRGAVVEGAVDFSNSATNLTGAGVTVLKYSAREVVLETDSDVPAYLVTSETFYPGWTTFVDGRPRPLYITNAAFRGLPVPAGRHQVRMRFSPAILWRAAGLSGIGWALLLALAGCTSLGRTHAKQK